MNISQFDRIEEYDTILSALPFNTTASDNGFVINSTQLATYLHRFDLCNEKYIPDEIKNAKEDVIRAFLDTYVIADGTEHRGEYIYYKRIFR